MSPSPNPSPNPRIEWTQIGLALSRRPARRLIPACARQAAVAVIANDGTQGIELLFVRRAEHPADPWSGHMAFPGGRAEPTDPDLQATAVRETHEEIGLDLQEHAELLGALDEIQAMRRNEAVDLSIAPFVFRLRAPRVPRTLDDLTLSDEVVSVHWVPLTRLFDPDQRGVVPIADGGPPRQRPCIQVDGTGGAVIWGLTFRMLEGFEHRLREALETTAAEQ